MRGLPLILWRLYLAPQGQVGKRIELHPDERKDRDAKAELGEIFGENMDLALKIEYVKLTSDGWRYGFAENKEFKAERFKRQIKWFELIALLIGLAAALGALLGPIPEFIQSFSRQPTSDSSPSPAL